MTLASRPASRVLVAAGLAAFALSACSPVDEESNSAETPTSASNETGETDTSTAAADDCAVDQLDLQDPGTLTVGTDEPAYDPWFAKNDPTNGKGFESAVAYAVADEMGFTADQVDWVTVPFNKSYAPGEKDFDFDINQISIKPARAEVVDFSQGYYAAAQGVIVLDGSPFADVESLSDLEDAKIGAQIGTTSLSAAEEVIQPATQVAVFDDTNAAKQALVNGQIDAIIVDLPTALYISAVEISDSDIVGQFQAESGKVEEFGLLFEKGNPLVTCVDAALARLKESGRLAEIEQEWLSQDTNIPELS